MINRLFFTLIFLFFYVNFAFASYIGGMIPGGSGTITEAELNALLSEKENTLTNSEGLAGALSDETGTGVSVFSTDPIFSNSVNLPNGASPTTDAAGELALDTTITDHQPLWQYYDGGENMTIIAIDTAEFPALDNEIIKYDAATDKFVLEPDGGASGSIEDDVYGSGWNGDTTNGASQNAIYDYLHQMDTDDDGSLADESFTWTGIHDFTGSTLILPVLGGLNFEGATQDDFETSFSITDPTADRTITTGDFNMSIPASTQVDASGNIVLGANTVDSDQYVDGSIDNEHLADDAVGTDEIATDAVTMDAIDADGNFTSLTGNWRTTGTLQGAVYTASYSANQTLTAAECYGGIIYVSAACTITLPAVAFGMHVTIYSTGANTIIVDANASDRIRLDGTALDDGDSIDSEGGAGDVITLVYDSNDGWSSFGRIGTWTDGGAS